MTSTIKTIKEVSVNCLKPSNIQKTRVEALMRIAFFKINLHL